MNADTDKKTVILALSGASGAQYGIRLLEQLLIHGHKVYLLVTRAAHVVISMETELSWPSNSHELQGQLLKRYGVESDQLKVCGEMEWTSPIASGSSSVDAMVVCPCSMGTLSSIAIGASANLLERAADVMLKERKKLVLVPRETPFSDIHLENMLKLSRMDAVIMPANPGFYNHPESVDDLVDFMAARILDHIGIPQQLQPKWGE
ncbi:MAG: UbiX family flavin prenyltransferase [Gammaproteobacteria bacterium]|nr:UbiX family flavin prenyltransferase [Gammaproteobacteria bacterium]